MKPSRRCFSSCTVTMSSVDRMGRLLGWDVGGSGSELPGSLQEVVGSRLALPVGIGSGIRCGGKSEGPSLRGLRPDSRFPVVHPRHTHPNRLSIQSIKVLTPKTSKRAHRHTCGPEPGQRGFEPEGRRRNFPPPEALLSRQYRQGSTL